VGGERIEVTWAPAMAVPGLADLLDETERARLADLRHQADRNRFVNAHALLRIVAGRRLDLAPAEVDVSTCCPTCGGPHGRPVVEGLQLSLSHAGGLVAVAATAALAVGIDVEPLAATRFDGFDEVALTSGERIALEALPPAERDRARTTWWTRKEAVLKATGEGLHVDPRSLPVHDADPRLRDLDLHPDYACCVAIAR
jgi:4'-phosphopantetheinyl transferase